ncbi:MAG TPA: Dam family site-specific DNA-(adenine-N6)-methyltransferase, partial [Candidatus Hydrogenedentes bacterium]|nr:Dam family site-specific DNA-(adenine-N6)-methyltransferase [Candidatus Hydrogenedentota bacterium]
MSSTRGQQDLFDSPPPARRRWGLVPRPFLKWAGGKGQLLGDLLPLVEAAEPFSRYHEPFVGGGALFFELARQGRLGRKKAWISDANPRLIEAYKGVQQDVEAVVQLLKVHAQRHCKDYYYEVRANVPDVLVERAARIIYLNRTCFNGLFRENSKGEFNVPFGRYKNPLICDEVNLRQVAEALARAHVEEQPFESVVERAEPGDLVYFDPPYDPVSKTSSFTSYHRGGFGPECQEQLAEVCKALDRKG